MNVENKSKTKEVEGIVKDMPFFSLGTLEGLNLKDYYLKIMLSRLKNRGRIVSLKRGIYVSSFFLEEMRRKESWNDYLEFLSSVLYSPSYLSLEYVLNEHNVLSEACFGFSSISIKKTSKIENSLGAFNYSNVKEGIFTGFEVIEKEDFLIYKATLAKALFDFLYLRKNTIISKDFFISLRLNTDQISKKDLEEFEKYVEMSGKSKMREIFKFLSGN